jgi:hypothetical protein
MRTRRAILCAVAVVGLTGALGSPASAPAAANPEDMLIYMPYGLVHFVRSTSEVDHYIAEVDSYSIGQVIFAMPKFKTTGTLKVPKHNREMLVRWGSRVAAYDAAHKAHLSLTVVFNGKVKTNKKGLDLDAATTRANIVSAVESSLGTGVSGVQLDLEPYPVSVGFLSLLEELRAMFARVGFGGRLSVTAPATISKWTPSYLKQVSQLVTQIDPLYYDSEYTSTSSYEAWVRGSLAYYTANVSAATRIVPVLPSYSPNPWHNPAVENISTATTAVSEALGANSRVNGAGIWWGYGFLLNEEGAYDGSSDRAAWQSTTVGLPFSP